jgi:hypothetical protein
MSSDSEEEHAPRPAKVPPITPRGGAPAPSYDQESNIHQKIELTLVLPDGTHLCKVFSKGDTVFNIKKTVHDEKGVEYKGMQVELEGKVLLDPLSLNDFPSLANVNAATFHIKIQ